MTNGTRSITIGLLYFDDSRRRTLEQKIQRAADRYLAKRGQACNLIYANPATIGEREYTLNGVTLKPARSILPDHFWLGVAVTTEAAA